MPAPAAVLLSGGMDSSTLLWWLKERGEGPLHAVSIDYRQRHRVELESAAQLGRRAGVAEHKLLDLDLTTIGGSPLTDDGMDVPDARDACQIDTVVPFRNMLFITLAAAYAETRDIHNLYIAPVRDDHQAYRDCRRPFYDSLEQSLRLGATVDRSFRIHTPFVDRWKSELLPLGLELGVPYELTHTCYAGRRPACGRCDACAERIAAFRTNGATDPLPYEIEIDWAT